MPLNSNNRYNFSSPGAAAVDELTQLLAERETRRRQALLDSLSVREMNLREAQEARQAEFQQQQFADQAFNREAQRVDREYDDSVAGDLIDAATAARWERHGRGGVLERGGPTGQVGEAILNPERVDVNISGPLTAEQMSALDNALTGSVDDLNPTQTKRTIAPGIIASKGGTKWRADRQAAQERQLRERETAAARESTAAATRQAQAERAEADRQMRLLIAQMAQSGNAATQALANQLKMFQIEKAQSETADRAKTLASAQSSTQTAYDLVDRLLDKNDVGGNLSQATGKLEMRGYIPEFLGGSAQGVEDFNSVRDQLIAALALPNLGMLKGPMSDKDVIFVKQLATRLANPNMSEAETARALREAQQFLLNKGATPRQAQTPAPAAAAPSGGLPPGVTVTRRN